MLGLLSGALHLLIAFNIYLPGTVLTMLLTVGMFGAWMMASRRIGACIKAAPEEGNPLRFCLEQLPPVFRYGLAFLMLYMLINFYMSLPWPDGGSGLFDFRITPLKLRGLSGFWMFFYSLAAVYSRR